jgi:hypothetical protein
LPSAGRLGREPRGPRAPPAHAGTLSWPGAALAGPMSRLPTQARRVRLSEAHPRAVRPVHGLRGRAPRYHGRPAHHSWHQAPPRALPGLPAHEVGDLHACVRPRAAPMQGMRAAHGAVSALTEARGFARQRRPAHQFGRLTFNSHVLPRIPLRTACLLGDRCDAWFGSCLSGFLPSRFPVRSRDA